MTNSRHSVVDNAISKLNRILKQEEDVPFLKTCPECNEPLRSEKDTISVIMESHNSNHFTTVSYYCAEHNPDLDNLDKMLTSYVVLIDFKIIEPSPDCSPSDRDIQIKEIEYELPSSYNI